MALETSPASPNLGCFVQGVDLATASADTMAEIRSLLFEHGVLFLRKQHLDPQQQIDFAEAIGDIVINRFFTPLPGFPKIAQLLTEPDQDWIIGEPWHTDHSYDAAPALGSILYAVEVPPTGGDTCFAATQAAYDALDEALKATLAGLQARHESAHVFAPSEQTRLALARERNDSAYNDLAASYPEAVHPVILAHPETGRKGLFVNPEFTTGIVGMDKAESGELLDQLYAHITKPQFTYRFSWEPGSVAIWDNRSTWHRAIHDYYGHRRSMRRITLAGVPLAA